MKQVNCIYYLMNGVVLACMTAMPVDTASATLITFEGFANGLDVETPATPFANISGGITSIGPGMGASIFDSTPGTNPADPDLWVGLGNILILQESGSSIQTFPGIWDTPDDEAGGGQFTFNFDTAVQMLSIDMIDINGVNQTAIVALFDSTGGSRAYSLPSEWTGDINQGEVGFATLDLTSLVPQVGVGPGTPSTTVTDFGLNDTDVIKMEVLFEGSAGLDNINFIPAPSTLLVILGAGLIGNRRKRRS